MATRSAQATEGSAASSRGRVAGRSVPQQKPTIAHVAAECWNTAPWGHGVAAWATSCCSTATPETRAWPALGRGGEASLTVGVGEPAIGEHHRWPGVEHALCPRGAIRSLSSERSRRTEVARRSRPPVVAITARSVRDMVGSGPSPVTIRSPKNWWKCRSLCGVEKLKVDGAVRLDRADLLSVHSTIFCQWCVCRLHQVATTGSGGFQMQLILALAVLMQALALLMAAWQLRRDAPRRGSVGMCREADSSEGRAGREDRSGGSPATDGSDPPDHPSARSAEYTIWLVLIRARSPDPAERLPPATHLQAQERAESAGCGDGALPPWASADWRLGPSGCSCAAAPEDRARASLSYPGRGD